VSNFLDEDHAALISRKLLVLLQHVVREGGNGGVNVPDPGMERPMTRGAGLPENALSARRVAPRQILHGLHDRKRDGVSVAWQRQQPGIEVDSCGLVPRPIGGGTLKLPPAIIDGPQ